MLVSYQWLSDYIDVSDLTPEEVAEFLTRGGVEVDKLHRYHNGIDRVIVGEMLETAPHPEADKLTICQVDTGDKKSQIICGAKNVIHAKKVAVALPGTTLPGGNRIDAAEIRGERSEGMICALDELGVDDRLIAKEQQDKIVVLPDQSVPGDDALEILGLNDVILELDLTPNRSDCLSMIGVAYELSALLDRPLHFPETEHGYIRKNAADRIAIEVEDGEAVPYYGAKMVEKLTISPSPLWMQSRLMAGGMRPVNIVVDITNYILLEYGQPLHAFDYDQLGSERILTRNAKPGETIQTLDEKERKLTTSDIVITNGEEPVAVAGVMGGAFSEVNPGTTTVLLEAAQFHPGRIRATSKALGLRSEASMRYEKGLDTDRTAEAAARTAYLLEKYAGGRVLNGIVEVDSRPQLEHEVSVNLERINARLGTELEAEQVEEMFYRLGFDVQSTSPGSWFVNIPRRRLDIAIEEDLIEEAARIYGYDRIPTTLPTGERTAGALTEMQQLRRKLRRYLERSGLYEAITYTLTSREKADQLLVNHEENSSDDMKVLMPVSSEREVLRKSLLPHLLDTAVYNVNRQNSNLAFFEIGSVFQPKNDENVQPEEPLHIAGVLCGHWQSQSWNEEEKQVDFYVVKGIIEGLLEQVGKQGEAEFRASKREGMHPGRTAEIRINGEIVGFLGELHPLVVNNLGLPEATYVFELDSKAVLSVNDEALRYEELPRFPTIRRDLAVVLNANIAASEVKAVIAEAAGDWLVDLQLFDVYQGEHIEAGNKSLAFSLTFLNRERTLTDEEVSKKQEDILASLKTRLGAKLRD